MKERERILASTYIQTHAPTETHREQEDALEKQRIQTERQKGVAINDDGGPTSRPSTKQASWFS